MVQRIIRFTEFLKGVVLGDPGEATSRIIVFRYDKLGDLVASSPVFRAIKESQPKSHVTLVASSYNASVLEHVEQIDQIVIYDPSASWRSKLSFTFALRRLHPDVVFVLSPSSGGYWMALFTGARRRFGLIMSYRKLQRLLAPFLMTDTVVVDRKRLDRVPDALMHQAEIALRMADSAGFCRPQDISLLAPTSAQDKAWASELLTSRHLGKGIILVHIGVTWRDCGLSPQGLLLMVSELENRYSDTALILTAGPADQTYLDHALAVYTNREKLENGELLTSQDHPRVFLFAGIPFGRWNALIEVADMVVSPDTGAVHLASAHRTPLVAVYASWRHNAMTSLFGPWNVPHIVLRGGEAEDVLRKKILQSVGDLKSRL